jgi:divalent metal cation (Fe/Co/Zn/Cd) transporter
VIVAQSTAALAAGARPATSNPALIAAGVSLAVLTPLAYGKRRLGAQLASRALQGDGILSCIGAATSLLALTALALYHTLGWWWPDPAAALTVAAIAAAGAWHTAPRRHPHRLRPDPAGTCGMCRTASAHLCAGMRHRFLWREPGR